MSQETGRPSWMGGDSNDKAVSTGSRKQSESYVKSLTPQSHTIPTWQDGSPRLEGFPISVVKGVKIIAWLMLINTSIGVSFAIVSIFQPRGTETGYGRIVSTDDYFSPIRLVIALVLGIAMAIGVWNVVDGSD